ncbi:MAG: hypothetical protein NTZ74_01560 [Chloroflexi bacterium]|nr:hypothetical protein [Chloroflexota bacterium]
MENRKPVTPEKAHSQQVIVQILIPILAAAILGITAVIYLSSPSVSQRETVQNWAQISQIVLIAPLFLIGLANLIVTVLLVKVIVHWNSTLPPVLQKLRVRFLIFGFSVQDQVDKSLAPLIRIKSLSFGLTRLFQRKK